MADAAQFIESYRDMTVRGASRIRLVVALYETLIGDCRRAAQAIRQGDCEGRHRETDHALVILQQLQGSLNMKEGGEPARQLDAYYNTIRAQLLQAIVENSSSTLASLAEQITPVRDAWLEVEKADSAQGAGQEKAQSNSSAPLSSTTGWRV